MANTAARGAGWALPVLELFGITVLAFLVSLVAGVAFIVPMFVLGYDLAGTAVLLGATAAGQVAFLAVGYAYVRVRDVPVPVRRPSKRDLVVILAGVVLALVVATGLSVLLSVLDLVPDSVIGDVATTDPTFLLGLAALSVVLVAPAEELLFRGAIQGRLRQRIGPIPAVLGASLLFGSMHLANYSGRARVRRRRRPPHHRRRLRPRGALRVHRQPGRSRRNPRRLQRRWRWSSPTSRSVIRPAAGAVSSLFPHSLLVLGTRLSPSAGSASSSRRCRG